MRTKTNNVAILNKWHRVLGLAAGAIACSMSAGVYAQGDMAEIDYSQPATWLCSPENNAACAVDISTTIVAADGTLTRESFMANNDAPVDCFYVYPTVSLDATANSDMNPGPEEFNVVRSQLARYGSECRIYAPMYRQFTLAALRGNLGGASLEGLDRNRGYKDVLNAWNYYLENENEGRGVIFVGHSQGSGVLMRMLAAEVDGKPIEKQIVAAHLIGMAVQVPNGEVVGGSFKSMPLCESADQTGCIVNYSAFRNTLPPADVAMFGRGTATTQAACTNPAQLLRGSTEVHAYLSNPVTDDSKPSPFVNNGKLIDTPFVSVPGLLTGECVQEGRSSYLEITVNSDPTDPRADTIIGDVMTPDGPSASWGLHLIDVNVVMGDLVGLAAKQSEAWLAKQ